MTYLKIHSNLPGANELKSRISHFTQIIGMFNCILQIALSLDMQRIYC